MRSTGISASAVITLVSGLQRRPKPDGGWLLVIDNPSVTLDRPGRSVPILRERALTNARE